MSTNATLGSCDMILAISESEIGRQFLSLFQKGVIKNTWNIIMYEDKNGTITQVKTDLSSADYQAEVAKNSFTYAFTAELTSPTISILESERIVLEFGFGIKTGTMSVWAGHGPQSTLQQVDMANWAYAFKTGIGSIEKSADSVNWITPEAQQQASQVAGQLGLPQNLFLAQSLFIDFNNVNYSEYDQLKSRISSDVLQVKIFQYLLSNYLKRLASTNNPYILAYGLKINSAYGSSHSLFSPTDLRYSTSYHSNPDLCAFNFLMMIAGNIFPSGQNVGILPQTLLTTPGKGRMEIDKLAFGSALGKLISPSLNGLCIVPSSNIHCNTVSISVRVSFSGDTSTHAYQLVNDGSSHILTFSYSKDSHDSDTSGTFFPPFVIWGNISTTISVQSDVYLEGNVIRINTVTDCYMHLNTEGGVSSGDLIKYVSEIKYTLGVDSSGKITLTAGAPSFSDQSSFDVSGWSKFLSFGEINGMVDTLKNYWSVMKQFLTGQQDYISLVINGSSCWAFPLGKIYNFTNAQFAANQDLIADATYNPS